GAFKLLWTPPKEGTYFITAVFSGSKSYWDSYASTAIAVTTAPPAAATAEQAGSMQASVEELKQAQQYMQSLVTALIVIVVICIMLVVYDIYINRKMLKKS
ncbi:MAG: hypothetical protein QW056_02590, partial [Candidatus Bathyarchaeia archaeon]